MEQAECRTGEKEALRELHDRWRLLALLLAAGLIILVGVYGVAQFRWRADNPISLVKERINPPVGEEVDQYVLRYIEDARGEVAGDSFTPSWGAEQTGKGEWKVSFVYEVGREAHWVAWTVDVGAGRVIGLDGTAAGLLDY